MRKTHELGSDALVTPNEAENLQRLNMAPSALQTLPGLSSTRRRQWRM